MKIRWMLLALLLSPSLAFAADCTETSVLRNNSGFTVKRFLISDADTGISTSTKCVPPQFQATGGMTTAPWDFYRIIAEEGDTCTSWTAEVRDYPINSTAICRGTCDPHILGTFDKSAKTSQTFHEPLGEAFDVNITAITCTGGLSVFADFYYRNESR